MPVVEEPPEAPLLLSNVIVLQAIVPFILERCRSQIPSCWPWEGLSVKFQHQLHQGRSHDERGDDREWLGSVRLHGHMDT